MTILRNVLAIVAGFVVGSLVNITLVSIGPAIIPLPPGVDFSDPEALERSGALLEGRHFVFPFLAHALGTLAGAFVAYLVGASYRRVLALVIGVAFLAGGIVASTMIPAPVWFIVLDLLAAYLPMAWLGALLGERATGRGDSAGA